jgi:hypothetical protein
MKTPEYTNNIIFHGLWQLQVENMIKSYKSQTEKNKCVKSTAQIPKRSLASSRRG